MNRKLLIVILSLAIGCLFILPAFAQDDMMLLGGPDYGFEHPERPSVNFSHTDHMDFAGVDGCMPCHHEDFKGGEFIEGDTVRCMECHTEGAAEGTPLMKAYHSQCIDCHEAQGAGPQTCGECHVR